MASTNAASTSSNALSSSSSLVTLPPSLAFLISNFHSVVNIKLDASNYLLWRVQVKNVLITNGLYGYLDGSVVIPPAQIQDTNGNTVPNPDFLSWTLLD
ncbi:hypothetical protein Vadar_001701 [Vaccinium darrowii]|uniref:Uncharacterized protein n=1 Tax=Vaccinium darrowii TaxID=229202 RepID=A0ACB7YSK0_9ERIC|nr:hypothetical protein Vadar_001701 [Vaccinium darrowii]